MLISRPNTETTGDAVIVSARVTVDTCPSRIPDVLWFRFPRAYADSICNSSNAFAVAMLPLAMHLGEDMHVEGHISPRLMHGLRDYIRAQITWQPTRLRAMKITAEELLPTARPDRLAVATTFSGGVDSVYTLQNRSGERQDNPFYRITHGLLINGFDADSNIDDPQAFQAIADAQQAVMDRAGAELVVCTTNCMDFSDLRILQQTFGAVVTAPALALGRLFSALYIPSGYEFHHFMRDGSHATIDHLVSSESLEVIHDALDASRHQKVRSIIEWPEIRHSLRVCIYGSGTDAASGALTNCCRCEKCIRTMIALKLAGALDEDSEPFACFPRKLTHSSIITCAFDTRISRRFANASLVKAVQGRRWGIALDLVLAQVVTALLYLPRRLHRYAERRWSSYEAFMRRHFRLAPRFSRRIDRSA